MLDAISVAILHNYANKAINSSSQDDFVEAFEKFFTWFQFFSEDQGIQCSVSPEHPFVKQLLEKEVENEKLIKSSLSALTLINLYNSYFN